MNKKKLVLDSGTIVITYLIGAYLIYRKLALGISKWDPLVCSAIFLALLALFLLFFSSNFRKFQREKNDLHKNYSVRLNKAYEGTIKALMSALDCRDHGTWDHSLRVVGYATAIAEKMGIAPEERQKIALAGFLHDIGKIGVPDQILLKKTKLLPNEWEVIKRHPELGYEIIKQVDFLGNAADIILLHHEHYDGSGYPFGLKGEKIPLTARIFAVADALDAMTSDRPYRSARLMEEALHEVSSLSGTQFCPQCVKALEALGIENLHRIEQHVKKQETFNFLPQDLVRCS